MDFPYLLELIITLVIFQRTLFDQIKWAPFSVDWKEDDYDEDDWDWSGGCRFVTILVMWFTRLLYENSPYQCMLIFVGIMRGGKFSSF